ncbi:MAG: BON domain-containing protein [Acidobacteriota bacterium]|nr:BON domain-containing protein [Acidobacteriota bacterium]
MSTPAITSWGSERRARAGRPLVALALVVAALAAGGCMRPPSQAIDDATLLVRVKTALLNDPTIGAMRIEVDVNLGVVRLSGAVPSEQDIERAVGLARQVAGVRDVHSTIQIVPGSATPTPPSGS